jgi:hypothetical protein
LPRGLEPLTCKVMSELCAGASFHDKVILIGIFKVVLYHRVDLLSTQKAAANKIKAVPAAGTAFDLVAVTFDQCWSCLSRS